MLDFGCSTGSLLDLFREVNERYGVEVDENATKISEQKGYKVFKSITEAPSVDLITAVDVLEHLKSEEVLELLPQFYEHLNKNGILFIQTCNPYCFFSLMDFYNDFSHVRMYSPGTLCSLLILNKFSIVEVGFVGIEWMKAPFRLLAKLFEKIRLVDKRNFYYNYFVVARKL
jgi:cyclopropane fatty-acyl-phospholipid synthase-like methyltransferase